MTLATGYGSDLDCGSDLTSDMGEVDPFSPRALAQALLRRLDCPRGGLPEDDDYGTDLVSMLNRGSTAADVQNLGSKIRSELAKDDRVDSLVVVVSPFPNGKDITVNVQVTPVDPVIGTFSMTFVATTTEIVLREIST
jgi:hypothetical protein